jgi:hypothetical protein
MNTTENNYKFANGKDEECPFSPNIIACLNFFYITDNIAEMHKGVNCFCDACTREKVKQLLKENKLIAEDVNDIIAYHV